MADTYRTRAPGGRRPGRGCAAVACVTAFVLGVSLVGCGYGNAPSADTTPTTVITSTTPAPSDPPQGPSTTKATPATPPSTELGRPVLTELPPLTVDDVAEMHVFAEGMASPPRILSPGLDRGLVERFLADYGAITLDPGAGFPTMEGLKIIGSFQIGLRDMQTVGIYVPSEGNRVLVASQGEGQWRQQDPSGEAAQSPQAYGTAPGLATFLRELAAEEPPPGFGPGEPGLPEAMPADFGFILHYGVGPPRNALDTSAGTFSKDMIMDPNVTTDLRLSPEELKSLYRRMVEIGIEGYPRVFRPADTGSNIRPAAGMEPQYRLRLRADGRELTLDWADEFFSGTAEATALRKVFEGIGAMIEAREGYKKLPQASGGYM